MTAPRISLSLVAKQIAVFAVLGIWFAPVPAGLTSPAWHLFAVFAGAIVSVLLGAFPLLTSSMLAVAAVVLTGILDMSKAFAGGQTFELGPPFNTVYSENLTPAKNTGLKNWTPGLVKNLIKTGKTDTGDTICPPMPVGPNGAFGGMTDAHALAIGAYITSLPPIENGTDAGMFPMCLLPPGPPPVTDAGPDATSKDSGRD